MQRLELLHPNNGSEVTTEALTEDRCREMALFVCLVGCHVIRMFSVSS
jgi:hypothetical protein